MAFRFFPRPIEVNLGQESGVTTIPNNKNAP
jgi:hypothetical protein